MHHLPGYWLAAVRYIVILVWGTLRQSPTTSRLVFQSLTPALTSLTGLPPTSARQA
jgi:hypothetical protein